MPVDLPRDVSGTPTLSELIRFQYFHFNRRSWIASVVAGLFVLAVLVMLPLVVVSGDRSLVSNGMPFALMVLFWAALTFGNPYRFARKQFRTQQLLREPQKFTFSDESVRLEGPSFSTEVKWTLVKDVYETKSLFLIYQSPQMAWILPKRFFASEADTQYWRVFVRAHLTNPNLLHAQGWIGSWF